MSLTSMGVLRTSEGGWGHLGTTWDEGQGQELVTAHPISLLQHQFQHVSLRRFGDIWDLPLGTFGDNWGEGHDQEVVTSHPISLHHL